MNLPDEEQLSQTELVFDRSMWFASSALILNGVVVLLTRVNAGQREL